jgi:hypothetical protein
MGMERTIIFRYLTNKEHQRMTNADNTFYSFAMLAWPMGRLMPNSGREVWT